jgi:hypothetical protein
MIETASSIKSVPRLLVFLLLVVVALGPSAFVSSAIDLNTGDEAPDFSLVSANGKDISLKD